MHTPSVALSKWLDQIADDDPPRASALDTAPSSSDLASAITNAFRNALIVGGVRLGLEESSSNEGDHRAVLQFNVGAELFDRFFNARTGYRAQFRIDWKTGLAYNAEIISALRRHVLALPGSTVAVRRLSASFEDRGEMSATISQLVDSLEPGLSKIWFCTLLIVGDGNLQQLPLGLTGPRIILEDATSWAAPYREDMNAWLDVKGAFLSAAGPYQTKDPVTRAKTLQSKGEA